MICMALVIPLATSCLICSSTSLTFTSTLMATSLILAQSFSERTSSQWKFLAMATSFSCTRLTISLASVIFSLTIRRTISSTTLAFCFKVSAAALNFPQTSAEITSSHLVMAKSINSFSLAGNNRSLIFSMICLALVIPLATSCLICSSTSLTFTSTLMATSLILAQSFSERTSSQWKFLAMATSFSCTCLTISLASVIFSLTTRRTISSTTLAFCFKVSAAALNFPQTSAERTSSHLIFFAISASCCLTFCTIASASL